MTGADNSEASVNLERVLSTAELCRNLIVDGIACWLCIVCKPCIYQVLAAC